MKVYIINGYAESGKDTFVSYCQDIIGKVFCLNISTVDFVKEIATQCGWNGTKTPENRKFLSDLKDLLTEWNDVPFKKIKKAITCFERELEEYNLGNRGFVFIHCREPAEIQRLKEAFKAKTIFIERKEVEKIASNHADRDVEKYKYDFYIKNNSTLENLKASAKKFIEKERGR